MIRAAEQKNEVGSSDIAEQRYGSISVAANGNWFSRPRACHRLPRSDPGRTGVGARSGQSGRRAPSVAAPGQAPRPGSAVHDPRSDHALAVADDTLLILSRAEHVFGGVDAVLTESNLARMYGVR